MHGEAHRIKKAKVLLANEMAKLFAPYIPDEQALLVADAYDRLRDAKAAYYHTLNNLASSRIP